MPNCPSPSVEIIRVFDSFSGGARRGCQTRIVPEARMIYGSDLTYDGNRAIILDKGIAIHAAALQQGIAAAMTYHPG